jgi:hypothetical protein
MGIQFANSVHISPSSTCTVFARLRYRCNATLHPGRPLFLGDFTRRHTAHHVGFLSLGTRKHVTVQVEKSDQRRRADAFIAIDKRMVFDQAEGQDAPILAMVAFSSYVAVFSARDTADSSRPPSLNPEDPPKRLICSSWSNSTYSTSRKTQVTSQAHDTSTHGVATSVQKQPMSLLCWRIES